MKYNMQFRLAVMFGLVVGCLAQVQARDERTLAFWEAARSGDVERLQELLSGGIDVDAVTEFNCGAVYFAANRNQEDVLRVLVKAGADVNLRDTDYGFTPVQMAAWLGHTEATAILIDAGADKNDAVGSAFAAASNGHAETVKLIAQKLELPTEQLTALWNTAHSTGHKQVCDQLLELGAVPHESAEDSASAEAESDETDSQRAAPRFDFESDKPIPVTRAINWPAFHGQHRSGVADGQHPPAAFDRATGRNVKWRVPVEGLGLSSPIIWNDCIYITTAVSSATQQSIDDDGLGWISAVSEDVPHQWKVLCFDLQDGTLIWEQTACTGLPKSQRHWKASQANSTCVTDGVHLVACFGSEGLYCFDLEGELKWAKDLGLLNAGWYIDSTFPWGFASSPIIYGDSVILQCDVYRTPFIAAFQLADGQQIWRAERGDELPSWGTPLVVAGAERDELVTNASKAVRGYEPASGDEIWQVRGNSPITVSSPVSASGLIVATGGYKTPKPIYVVRAGEAAGDVTPSDDPGASSGLAWSQQAGGTYIVTPRLGLQH